MSKISSENIFFFSKDLTQGPRLLELTFAEFLDNVSRVKILPFSRNLLSGACLGEVVVGGIQHVQSR
jgi:hypothetical protein